MTVLYVCINAHMLTCLELNSITTQELDYIYVRQKTCLITVNRTLMNKHLGIWTETTNIPIKCSWRSHLQNVGHFVQPQCVNNSPSYILDSNVSFIFTRPVKLITDFIEFYINIYITIRTEHICWKCLDSRYVKIRSIVLLLMTHIF